MTEKESQGQRILDFASLCFELFNQNISDHDNTVKYYPQLLDAAKKIEEVLYEFYQSAGCLILEESPNDKKEDS